MMEGRLIFIYYINYLTKARPPCAAPPRVPRRLSQPPPCVEALPSVRAVL